MAEKQLTQKEYCVLQFKEFGYVITRDSDLQYVLYWLKSELHIDSFKITWQGLTTLSIEKIY